MTTGGKHSFCLPYSILLTSDDGVRVGQSGWGWAVSREDSARFSSVDWGSLSWLVAATLAGGDGHSGWLGHGDLGSRVGQGGWVWAVGGEDSGLLGGGAVLGVVDWDSWVDWDRLGLLGWVDWDGSRAGVHWDGLAAVDRDRSSARWVDWSGGRVVVNWSAARWCVVDRRSRRRVGWRSLLVRRGDSGHGDRGEANDSSVAHHFCGGGEIRY